MKPLTLSVAALLLCMGSVRAEAQVSQTPTPASNESHTIGHAVHWCVFNRPCNWTGHASIAFGVVWGLDRMNVPTKYAAAASALLFFGKEVRDDLKWGHVLGTTDSMGDMLSGFAGAAAGYVLFHDTKPPVEFAVQADGATTVGVRLPAR
jgi:hypothetical protein